MNGCHYQKTLEAWLKVMDSKKDEVKLILTRTDGAKYIRGLICKTACMFIGVEVVL